MQPATPPAAARATALHKRSAEDAAQFQALLAYSPYHRAERGVRYPAVLMSSADHDDRVDPMHARHCDWLSRLQHRYG